MNTELIERLDWDKQAGLIPAIVQDAASQQVLMLGYMNREALSKTLQSRVASQRLSLVMRGRSRSKQQRYRSLCNA